jgi:HlyD family secretion protein
MLRKKGFWIVLVLVLLAAGAGGVYYYRNGYANAQETGEEPLQTATVRRGSIIISASGAGTVIPAAEVDLGFQSGGLLTELLVEVGDRVQAGDVLARVDDSQARAALIAAELQVIQAQDKLAEGRDTEPEQRDLELAEANQALAQLRLDELLNWAPDEEAIEQAQANLEAAHAEYEAAQNKSAYDQTASVRISLEQAQQNLADAQAAYDQAWEPARDWELWMTDPTCQAGQGGNVPCTGTPLSTKLQNERDSTTRNLERAQQSLEVAQANYNLAWAAISDTDELSAWNKVLSAQASLEAAQTGPTDEEIQSARIQVLQADISLANAQAALATSSEELELTLEQAQLNLEAAQKDLDNTVLVASMEGTVMAVTAQAGDNVGSAALITLADIEYPSVEVYLDETDLNSVGVGFEVEVVFDALPDEIFTGQVVHVDPSLVSMQNMMMVRAVIQLDAASYAKPQIVPVGANATVDVIGGKTENALIVPVEALNEYTTGKYAVFKMVDNEPVFTPVEVGLMDYSFAEILSGLEQGDVVTTGIMETGG